MTVFVVNRVSDNISAAEKFGGLRFINERYVYGDELEQYDTFQTEWMIPLDPADRLAATAAEEFEPEFDYLLIAGDHLQLVAFVGLLTRHHGTFRVLRYDRKLNDYIPVRLDFRIAPSAPDVLTSPPSIGDNSGQDNDQDNDQNSDQDSKSARELRFARRQAEEFRAQSLEAPLGRRDPRKR